MWLNGFATIVIAYVVQFNVLPVYQSLPPADAYVHHHQGSHTVVNTQCTHTLDTVTACLPALLPLLPVRGMCGVCTFVYVR